MRSRSWFRSFQEQMLSPAAAMILIAAATEGESTASGTCMRRPGETPGIMIVQIVLPCQDGMVTQREYVRQTLASVAARFASDQGLTPMAGDRPQPVQSDQPHWPQSDGNL